MTIQKTSAFFSFLIGCSALVSMAGLEISASFIILIALVDFAKNRKRAADLTPAIVTFIPLGVLTLLSLAWNGYWQDIPQSLGWLRWIFFLVAFAYMIARLPSNKLWLRRGLYTGLIAGFINSVFQYITNVDMIRGRYIDYYADLSKQTTRVTGFFNMPTTYGYILAMFSLIPVVCFIQAKTKNQKILHGGIAALTFINLFMTYTRGAWLAVIAGLFILLAVEKRRWIVPGMAALILAVGIGLAANPGFRERVTSLGSGKYYSNLQRIELWKANWAIFKDYPILGAGFRKNDIIVEDYHQKLGHVESYRSHAHNSYLQFLAGTGLLGLISFLAFISSFFYVGIRKLAKAHKQYALEITGLMAIAVTFVVSSLFDCNFGDSEVRYSFLIYMALLLAAPIKSEQPPIRKI